MPSSAVPTPPSRSRSRRAFVGKGVGILGFLGVAVGLANDGFGLFDRLNETEPHAPASKAVADGTGGGAASDSIRTSSRSESLQESPLNIVVKWPDGYGECSSASLAMRPGGPSWKEFSTPSQSLSEHSVARGAGAWRLGTLTVDLSTEGEPLHILGITVNARRTNDVASWRSVPTAGGCGDDYEVYYGLDLDDARPHLVRVDPTTGKTEPDPDTSFVVATGDPARVTVFASLEDSSAAFFDLRIKYALPSELTREKIVDSAGQPFRIFALSAGTDAYECYTPAGIFLSAKISCAE